MPTSLSCPTPSFYPTHHTTTSSGAFDTIFQHHHPLWHPIHPPIWNSFSYFLGGGEEALEPCKSLLWMREVWWAGNKDSAKILGWAQLNSFIWISSIFHPFWSPNAPCVGLDLRISLPDLRSERWLKLHSIRQASILGKDTHQQEQQEQEGGSSRFPLCICFYFYEVHQWFSVPLSVLH